MARYNLFGVAYIKPRLLVRQMYSEYLNRLEAEDLILRQEYIFDLAEQCEISHKEAEFLWRQMEEWD